MFYRKKKIVIIIINLLYLFGVFIVLILISTKKMQFLLICDENKSKPWIKFSISSLGNLYMQIYENVRSSTFKIRLKDNKNKITI